MFKIFESPKFKIAILILSFILLIFALGRSLNPFDQNMFEFHDETQAARIEEFLINIENHQIPPRLAPNFSFRLGYPVFNFYAPFSYWITAALKTTFHITIVSALKLSFLLAVITAFGGCYLFLKRYFRFYSSLLGASLYVTCLYMAVDIFVRGNLAETWFLALFPMSLYLIFKNAQRFHPIVLITTVFLLSALLTTHNLLSFLSIPIILIYIFLQKTKKRNILAFILALLLGTYFFLPLLTESGLTYAKEVATKTVYKDHFLCLYQLWDSPWGYGGSTAGCVADGMSFKLGKIHILFFLAGLGLFIFQLLKKRPKNPLVSYLFAAVAIFSLFLTTYQSQVIWDSFASILAIIQFPWRFISFSLIGIAYFSAYFWDNWKLRFMPLIVILITIVPFTIHAKYFTKTTLESDIYKERYLSSDYINTRVASKVSEYLPKTADYDYWYQYNPQGLERQNLIQGIPIEAQKMQSVKTLYYNPFQRIVEINQPQQIKVNIHYFPFWHIYINNKEILPTSFDKLGKPIIQITQPSTVKIVYHETNIEKLGDTITLLTGILLMTFICSNLYNPLWKRIHTIMS